VIINSQHLHHHLLRHSFGTIATISGMNPHAINEIMRHSDISTTMIYQNLAADFLKSEGRKFLSNGG
jgi:site-specific recombinase XerD